MSAFADGSGADPGGGGLRGRWRHDPSYDLLESLEIDSPREVTHHGQEGN